MSGLDRSLPMAGNEPSLVGLLQTDAAGAVSIGFAIPAPTVRDIVSQLIENGRVEHPYLGVRLAPAADASDGHVVAVAVEEDGPAADAGIRGATS